MMRIGLREIEMAIELLKTELNVFSGREYFEHEVDALQTSIRILEDELERNEDELAHSGVTIEMEHGRYIPLKEWARRNCIDESTARQKARRGGFSTAHKKGRDWFISEFELNFDGRRKKSF